MTKPLMVTFVGWILLSIVGQAQEPQSLDKELKRFNTESALIIPAEGVDEYPLWSPQGDYIAANIQGKWYKVNLNRILLEDGTWRGKRKIGVTKDESFVSNATEKEVEEWKKVSKLNPREVLTKSGIKIELKAQVMSTSLIVTKKSQKPNKLWSTDMENCHSLVLSPDEQYVAFIAELNGVVIMKLDSIP